MMFEPLAAPAGKILIKLLGGLGEGQGVLRFLHTAKIIILAGSLSWRDLFVRI